MKNLIIILILLSPAAAWAGPYASLNAGAAILENHELHFEEHTYKIGHILTGALGWDFGYIRAEVEAVQTRNKQDMTYYLDWTPKGTGGFDVTKRFYFINGLVDIPVYGGLEAYVGAGYGFPRYQLLAGFKYNVTKRWAVSLGYRFIHEPYDPREYYIGDHLWSGPEPVYENHGITAGITFYLW